MADVAGFRIEGVNLLVSKLRRLDEKMKRRSLDKALRAGAVIYRKAAKQEAPVGPKQKPPKLVRKTGFRKLKKRGDEVSAYVIRAKVPHAHLVQLGTADRRNKSGANRGSVSPNNFMERAFNKATAAANAAVVATLAREVNAAST